MKKIEAKTKPAQMILDLIATDPTGVREALRDSSVVAALDKIGVRHDPKMHIRELHAPGRNARTETDTGVTLCGQKRGTRHAKVTCKICLKKQART